MVNNKSANNKVSWTQFYDSLNPAMKLWEHEAAEYTRNLDTMQLDLKKMKILDFGCGCGLIAESMAVRARCVDYWDLSKTMLEAAQKRLRKHGNTRFIDLSKRDLESFSKEYDLILVNSVIQYMSFEEFEQWLLNWSRMLAMNGMLVISDIMTPETPQWTEKLDILKFWLRSGCMKYSYQMIPFMMRYYRTIRDGQYLRLTKNQIARSAEKARYSVRYAQKNMTHFQNRLTAIMTDGREAR